MTAQDTRQALQQWFGSPLGQMVRDAEHGAVCELLGRREGMHLLQVGAYGSQPDLCVPSAVRHWTTDVVGSPGLALRAWPDDLPLKSDSLDAVVLVHVLEFADAPHPILREAVRVLAPDGVLLIIGFNPLSLWGLNRAVLGLCRFGVPWSGHYYGAQRLKDWCSLLSMEPIAGRRLLFRPPIGRPGLQQRLMPLESFGSRWLSWFGGVNIVVSRKRVSRIIPFSSKPMPVRSQPQGVQGAQNVQNGQGRYARSNTQTRSTNKIED